MNADKLKEALDKIPFAPIMVVAAMYHVYLYYTFTYEDTSPYRQKTAQIETTREANKTLALKVKQAEEFFRSLDTKKTQLRELAGRLDEMKSALTEDLDVAEFMRMTVTEGKKVGLNILSLRPTTSKNQEFYIEQAFEMTFRGVYVQLVVFMDRLASLKKIVRADNFQIRPVTGNANSRFVQLEGSIELKAYRYLPSKADGLGRQGSAAGGIGPASAESKKGGG